MNLLPVLFMLFLDILGFSLFIPLLPNYVTSLGGDAFTFGLVMAAYAAGSFVAAPLWGALSDRWGRRPVLMVSSAGSLAAWLGLALAPDLLWLFIARIFGGLMAAKANVAQSWIVDVSTPETRTRNLGFTGIAFGAGFVVGPPLGGVLSLSGGLRFAAAITAVLVALSLVLTLLFVQESKPAEAVRPARVPGAKPPIRVLGLLALGFFLQMGFNLFQTMFAAVTQLQLGWTPVLVGLALAWSGILGGVLQGGGLGALSKRFGDRRLFLVGLAALTAALLAWAFTNSGWYLFAVLVPLALGAALATIVWKSLLAHAAADRVGTVLGWAGSAESLTRILAPALGGWLTVQAVWGPGVVSSVLVLASLIAAWFWVPRPTEAKPT